MARFARLVSAAGALALASGAMANVTFQSQQRSISVATTANGATQMASAANLGPFVENVGLETLFQGATGTLTNGATGRIDCQIDPNSIRARGTFTVQGGQNDVGVSHFGEADVDIQVTYVVVAPTAFSLMASPRPSLLPTDHFEIELKDVTRNVALFAIDETVPPQQVGVQGTLQPGSYQIKFKAESTGAGGPESRDFAFNLSFGCRADFDGSGEVTTLDVIGFVGAWLDGDLRADVDLQDGVAVADIFAFLNAWFAGC